jgi:hypothetical protein
MDWILGLGTITFIVGGGYLFGWAVFRHSFPVADAPPKQPVRRSLPDPPKQTMRQIADMQSDAANARVANFYSNLSVNGYTEIAWIHCAARHLMALWPGMSLEKALQELRDYMPDKFGDSSYIWTRESAIEFAVEYTRNFGEDYGSNT